MTAVETALLVLTAIGFELGVLLERRRYRKELDEIMRREEAQLIALTDTVNELAKTVRMFKGESDDFGKPLH